jgi:general stress protein 26
MTDSGPSDAEHRPIRAVMTPAMEQDMANDNTANDIQRGDLKIGFAMPVTRRGDKLRARPMSTYLERDENTIYFLADARRHEDEEIARDPHVNLAFPDPGSQKYAAL